MRTVDGELEGSLLRVGKSDVEKDEGCSVIDWYPPMILTTGTVMSVTVRNVPPLACMCGTPAVRSKYAHPLLHRVAGHHARAQDSNKDVERIAHSMAVHIRWMSRNRHNSSCECLFPVLRAIILK